MALSLCAVFNFCREEPNLIKRGEIAVKDGHVEEFLYAGDVCAIKGKVQASMKNRIYDVELCISEDGERIVSQSCTCPRGQLICHHMVAISLYAIQNVSKTDRECAWKKPRMAKEIQPVTSLYPRPKPFRALTGNVDMDSLRKKMATDVKEQAPDTALRWLLEEEPNQEETLTVLSVQEILYSSECLCSHDPVGYVMMSLSLTSSEVEAVEVMTRGQYKNPLWHKYRSCRITASMFGKVVEHYNKGRFPPSLFRSLLGQYNLGSVKAVQWGLDHEPFALKQYQGVNNIIVKPCGVFLDARGCIGASPDGVIDDFKIIEIKCPFSKAETGVVEAIEKGDFYLHKNDKGEICLNLANPQGFQYHHQVQASLHITKRNFCDFIVWTPKDMCIITIEREESYTVCIDTVIAFYKEHLLPHILPQNDILDDNDEEEQT